MAELKVSAEERSAVMRLGKDVRTDQKVAQRLLNDFHAVLRDYGLFDLVRRVGEPLVLDLHYSPRRLRVEEEDFLGIIHIDAHGGHNDSVGHTDGSSWHVDF